jgi:AraC-like DNA-binding protein
LGAFVAFQLTWLLYLVPYVIPSLSDKLLNAVNWYPVYIPLTALIYWLGIKGIIISYQQQQQVNKAVPLITTTLSPQVIADISAKLQRAMDADQLYLDPELTLAQVAIHTGIPQKNISAVINQHLNKSFNEFVNGYRIDAFKQMIMTGDVDYLTMAGVALQCGFNSQATFQRTFKQLTGLSPSAFRKSLQVAEIK